MKSRVSQLFIAACLSASMALAAVPAGAAPVYAAEESGTADTEQSNLTGKFDPGTPQENDESSGGTQQGSEEDTGNTKQDTGESTSVSPQNSGTDRKDTDQTGTQNNSQSSGQNNASGESKDGTKGTEQGGSAGTSQGETQEGTNSSTKENDQKGTTSEGKENTPGGTQDGSQGNDGGSTQGAITSGSYITPPETVRWIDKDNLILGFSPVGEADWYEIRYTFSDQSTISYYRTDLVHETLDNGLYRINVSDQLQNHEATFGEAIVNPVLINIYAGTGSYRAVIRTPDEKMKSTTITVDNYKSCLADLTETPAPKKVKLTLDNNKLVVSFQQDKVDQSFLGKQDEYGLTYPYEYQLYFYLNNTERDIYRNFCFEGYTDPGNSVWTVGDKGIEIPVSDYIRSTILEKVDTGAENRKLSVAVKAKAGGTDSNGNIKYKVSQLSSRSEEIDYKDATFTTMSVDEDKFKTGSAQDISPSEIKKLCPKAPDNASLKLEVKANTADDNDQKAEAFKKDTHINASYSDFSTFEVNLNLVTKGDGDKEEIQKVTDTASTLLITIPIPVSLQGKSIVILRNHDGVIEEVGSVVSADGKTVSFYTDKFSDYAIAVKKDNQGTVEEGGKDNPSTEPTTPSDPGTSVTTPSAPSGPDTSAAVKTVAETTAAVKGIIDASTLAESSKKLAGSLIDAIKAEADKKMAAASSQSDANAIAEQAKKNMEAVQARAEKAGKIADVPAAGDLPTAVQYGMIKGYINGTSDTAFQPAGSVTRAQFAAFLYRLAGSPETSGTGAFSDTASVSGGADFAKAIA